MTSTNIAGVWRVKILASRETKVRRIWRTIFAGVIGVALGEVCGIGLYALAKAADAGVYNWYSGDLLGDIRWARGVLGSFVLIPLCMMTLFAYAGWTYKRQ